ncbi:hypothetical protein AB0G95_21805 [Streptomyces virginiae]|uniref:hypothetical protein n=1 Tax=Streptomyces virginiae TaxID=1961 RepID=UPI003429C765
MSKAVRTLRAAAAGATDTDDLLYVITATRTDDDAHDAQVSLCAAVLELLDKHTPTTAKATTLAPDQDDADADPVALAAQFARTVRDRLAALLLADNGARGISRASGIWLGRYSGTLAQVQDAIGQWCDIVGEGLGRLPAMTDFPTPTLRRERRWDPVEISCMRSAGLTSTEYEAHCKGVYGSPFQPGQTLDQALATAQTLNAGSRNDIARVQAQTLRARADALTAHHQAVGAPAHALCARYLRIEVMELIESLPTKTGNTAATAARASRSAMRGHHENAGRYVNVGGISGTALGHPSGAAYAGRDDDQGGEDVNPYEHHIRVPAHWRQAYPDTAAYMAMAAEAEGEEEE